MGFQGKGVCRVPLPQKLVLEGSRVPGKESQAWKGITRGQGRVPVKTGWTMAIIKGASGFSSQPHCSKSSGVDLPTFLQLHHLASPQGLRDVSIWLGSRNCLGF